MSSHNISLPSELSSYVSEQVSSGRYGSVSEVFRSALRIFQTQEEVRALKIKALEQALEEGERAIAEGRTTRLETAEEISTFVNGICKEVVAEANA